MEYPSRTGLRKKFFIALLIAGIVPGIVALIATYLYSTDSLKHSIGSGFQEIARSTAIRISTAVDMEIDRAAQLAAAPILIRRLVELSNQDHKGQSDEDIKRRLESGRSEPFNRNGALPRPQTIGYLEKWIGKGEHYVRVMVTDKRGMLVASNDPFAPSFNAEEQWWQEAFKGALNTAFVSSLRLHPVLKEYVFEVAVPIPSDDHDEAIGVVGLIVRREMLMDTILPIKVGETGHGMLMDTAGTPLVCPVLPPTAHLIHETLLNQLSDQPQWLVVDDDAHGGRDSIIGAAPVRFVHTLSPLSLGGSQWFAFVRQQPEETFAPIYSLLLKVGLIGFGLVVALASLGVAVGRRIVAPILVLRRETDALRQDIANLAQATTSLPPEARKNPIEIKTGDEIEDLAHTFNAMRHALEDSLHTVTVQQDELIRKEKLASVGQLLAALAHDLRNPLGVIRSSAQLVLEERQSDAVKQEVTRYIIEEVDKLTHRINDFLRYARQKPPEPKQIAAEAVAMSALRQWNVQEGHDQITVTTRFDPGLPDLCVDPDQVKEALVNLLMNAAESMPGGGHLMIVVKRDDYGGIAIEVTDNGCGISETNRRRIFEPFFTTKEFGTGLGLTNVKRLVEDNCGTIDLDSERKQGSRFIVRFPTADPPFHSQHTPLELESGSS